MAVNGTFTDIVYVLGDSTSNISGYDVTTTNFTKNEYICSDEHGDYQLFYEWAQFITALFVYPIVCFLGIIGNTLALIVLSHKDMATSTNVYLSALAVSDTIKLLNDMLYFVMIILKKCGLDDDAKIISHYYPYAHYIFNMSVCVTAWLTVSVAIERYISVCHPTRAKSVCTIQRARWVSTIVFITMITLTIPSALGYTSSKQFDPFMGISCYKIIQSSFGRNEKIMEPYRWIQNSLRSIIPLFVLIVLNFNIVKELRKSRVKGKKLSSRNRITLMLIVIILFFVVCIMPDAVMSLFFGFGYVEEGNLIKGIREITDSLLAINSAFNFVLYTSMSVVFRNTFLKIFCKNCYQQNTVTHRLTNGATSIATRETRESNCTANNNKETFV